MRKTPKYLDVLIKVFIHIPVEDLNRNAQRIIFAVQFLVLTIWSILVFWGQQS